MSHQVRLFLTPRDISELEERLRALGGLSVLHSRSSQPAPRVVPGLNVEEDGKRWLHFYLVQPELLPQVITSHVPAQRYWSVDITVSPIIEFSGCFFDGQILREGRMYYTDGFYDANHQWQEKPEVFRTWAKSLFAKTKRSLQRRHDSYLGGDAERWLVDGAGKLVTGTGQIVL